MTLKQFVQEGKIRPHHTSPKEIRDLFELVDRDTRDALAENISCDRKFATAYNAALTSATIILYCRGYQSYGKAHHFTVFQCLKVILGKEYVELADYFDSCRIKRNTLDYDLAGVVSEKEFAELIDEVRRFCDFVKGWVKKYYPKYIEGRIENG